MTATVAPGLVSTIIPVHNRAMLLREAVASVLAQTYRPVEIIVVDDGSTDDTPRVADALAAVHPGEVRVLHRRHKGGPGLAREAGRLTARGEFIQYLDSDDLLLPRKFEWQVAGLRAHAECGVAYGRTRHCTLAAPSEQRAWKRTGEVIDAMFPAFLQSRWWGTSTPLYRRALTDAAGGWLALSSEEDWEYDCRVAALGVRLFHGPQFVSEERDHAGPRLSRGGSALPDKLADRARAHSLIYGHAHRAGIAETSREMQHFARELFLLARQCGAAGLAAQSRDLFALAKTASGSVRARGIDFRLYAAAAAILGWPLAGKLACASDRLRK
jgi:glycosyltransferase involved in cell wall biosynthesis